MHCGVPLLFVLLDVITELGIHERIIAGSFAVLKAFRPKELFVDAVAEQFLPDVVIIRHPFRACRRWSLWEHHPLELSVGVPFVQRSAER